MDGAWRWSVVRRTRRTGTVGGPISEDSNVKVQPEGGYVSRLQLRLYLRELAIHRFAFVSGVDCEIQAIVLHMLAFALDLRHPGPSPEPRE